MVKLVNIIVDKKNPYYYNDSEIYNYDFTVYKFSRILRLKTSFMDTSWLISIDHFLDVLREYFYFLNSSKKQSSTYSKNINCERIVWSPIWIEFVIGTDHSNQKVLSKLIVDTKQEMIECVEFLIKYFENVTEDMLENL